MAKKNGSIQKLQFTSMTGTEVNARGGTLSSAALMLFTSMTQEQRDGTLKALHEHNEKLRSNEAGHVEAG